VTIFRPDPVVRDDDLEDRIRAEIRSTSAAGKMLMIESLPRSMLDELVLVTCNIGVHDELEVRLPARGEMSYLHVVH
jgi:hypothetical protein